jgi:hypothetical protein
MAVLHGSPCWRLHGHKLASECEICTSRFKIVNSGKVQLVCRMQTATAVSVTYDTFCVTYLKIEGDPFSRGRDGIQASAQ